MKTPEFIKLQQEYLSIKKGHTYTVQEFERQKELKENNAGTGKIYQQAESNLLAEKAKLKGLEEQMKQLGINPISVSDGNIVTQLPIKAPISGVVGHILRFTCNRENRRRRDVHLYLRLLDPGLHDPHDALSRR